MLCILGYAANASAIEIHLHHEPGEVAAEHAAHIVSFAEEAGEAGHDAASTEILGGQNTAIRAATAFFLIIKLSRGEYE